MEPDSREVQQYLIDLVTDAPGGVIAGSELMRESPYTRRRTAREIATLAQSGILVRVPKPDAMHYTLHEGMR